MDEKNANITKRSHAYKSYANTYSAKILNSFNSELQLKNTKSVIKSKLIDLLSELRWFKFLTSLVLEFEKVENDDKTIYNTFYLNSKAETVINESGNDDVFESIYNTILLNIQESLGQSIFFKLYSFSW